MRKLPKKQPKRTTRPRTGQLPVQTATAEKLYVVALLFVGALAVYLASNDQLNANAVSALGAVTTALVVLIKTSKK